jgi:hypothetical protein
MVPRGGALLIGIHNSWASRRFGALGSHAGLLDELPVRDAMNGDGSHLQVVAGSRRAWKVAFVFSIGGEACHHLVAFGDLLFDVVIAGRRFPKDFERLLQSFSPGS